MKNLIYSFIFLFIGTSLSNAQDVPSSIPFVTLRTGEVLFFDDVDLSKGKVLCKKDGVTTEYEKSACKNAVIAERKKDKLVIHRHVVFASSKIKFNQGGKGAFTEGDEVYTIVAKNGDDMIIYKNSPLAMGSGVSGNQTVYLHVKDGQVSKIEITEWRDDAYMQTLVTDFGICTEMSQALKDFKNSGKGARQMKYDFFMQGLEKKYLMNCLNP